MARSPMFDSSQLQSGSFQIPVFQGAFPPSFPPALPYPPPPLSNSWMAQCMPPPANVAPYYQPYGPPLNQGYNNWRGMRSRGCGRNKQWKQSRKQKQENYKSKEGGKDSGNFKCEPCESTFRTESDLNCHISQHRQCSNPGCHFMATSRVLKEHELIHTIPKELFFTSDEDIAKWRDERRKKYPTTERVKLKLQEEDEKLQRGETAKDDIHKYCKRGGAYRQHPAAKRGRGGRGRFQRSFRQGRGGRSPQHGKEVDTNDEGSLDQLASNLTKDTGITQSSSQKTTQPILRSNVKHKATLLEKLLTPEIRKERNTILQCIRHIVKNDFFGIEEPNNVDRNEVGEQEIVVSPDVAEHSVIPPPTDEQIDGDIILDGVIPSEPEIEYASDKVSISTD